MFDRWQWNIDNLVIMFKEERGNGSGVVSSGLVHPHRWSEVTRRLELWVQLRELNEAGEFTAVEVLPAKDVRTGGAFQLRQVWRRLIRALGRNLII